MIQLISSKNPSIKHKIHKFTYQGTFLGECFISAKIESEHPIDFNIGDYVEFRGEKFVLNYLPPKYKQAKAGSYGGAFVYDNIKFNSLADELTRVEFLDVVLSDNKIHYTSLSDFSFYASDVNSLADRIQANLDRVYSGDERWSVIVVPDSTSSDKDIVISKKNCWETLTLAQSEFGLNFIIRNRTIKIGTAGLAVDKVFGYGKGKGLYDIQQVTNVDAQIITRLRAYGSTRNMPHRYYNDLKNGSGQSFIRESVYVPNLMLPSFPYTISDPAKVFIDSDSMSEYGLREGSVYFDGSDDLPELYPSLEGMTKLQLNHAEITVSLKVDDNGNIDECLSADNPTDNGVLPTTGSLPAEFTIYLKDLGFDLTAKDSDGQYRFANKETMQISMKSGLCIGRTFDVVENGITKDTYLGYTRYKIKCKRFTDDSIAGGTAFPNNQYKINSGNRFVILGIDMPDVYVKAAAQRLKVAAEDYRALHDMTKYTYVPKIDEIFMANNPKLGEVIKEGDILNFDDTDLDIDAAVIIQSLKINVGDKLVPTYDVTLSNEQVTGTLDKIQNSINQLITNHTGVTLEQVKSLILTLGTKHFLSRINDDTAEGNIIFANNVSIEKDLTVHKDIIAKKSVISEQFGNSTFTSGQFGSGFRMWKDAYNGQSYAEFDNLLVRRNMDVTQLTINEIKSVGGQILVSLGHMVCSKVETVFNGYKCFFDTDNGKITNPFAPNDQLICQRFDTDRIIYYWRRVMQLGTDYVVLSNKDKDGDGIPSAGDEMIQFGNRTLTERQSAILISAYGSDAPSIKQYANVDTYNLTGKEITVISPNGNKFSGTFEVSTGGQKFRVPADRGIWDANTAYGYYDRVTHNGALWLCVIQEGQTTIHEPNDNLSHWLKQVSEGQKGEQGLQGVAGAKGEDGKTTYTWIRYADTITGGGISNLPTNKLYIGLAYNKTTATESNLPADYKWSLIKGDKGDTGVEGTKGKDGQTTYTWIKYADVADGTGLYDLPKSTTKYIGIAVNKTMAAESINKADYTWSLFKGEDGVVDYTTVKSIIQPELKVLDDKILLKVSQTDFSSLSGRVSTAESKIVQQAGQITSTVQKVEGKNAVYKSYTAAVTDRPPVPYAKNDIWITYEGEMRQCKTTRLTGAFVEADWIATTKYTDDTSLNNLQIGGRNYVLNTSNVWASPVALNNTQNQCIFGHKVISEGWKEGESICVSFEYKYDNIVKQGTSNYLAIQGGGNVTGYTNSFTGLSFFNKIDFVKGSGIVPVSYTFKLTAAQATNTFFSINIRHDYMTGSVSIRNLKVEKGTKPTDWIAAPEDIQDTITEAQTTANNAQQTAQRKVRYIRDWLNGSTTNKGNHWVQIAVYNSAGNNIALNKNVSGASTDKRITNGNIDSSVYTNTAEGLQQLTVDLGAVYDIHKVKVWHFYGDGRTYNATKTEVSVDNVNWITIFDSAVGGKHKETSAGNVCLVGDYANNVENQNRNRTYYSDTTPVVPEGGHRTGDLWYKISLTAGCYTTYRWNGTAWVVINEYVSKAQQIITDNSITNLVSKTGINSLGTGETLMSKINQTASNITLEVGKIQIGGTNLIPYTNMGITGWGRTVQTGTGVWEEVSALGVRAARHTTTVASTGYHVLTHGINRSLIKNNTQYTISFDMLPTFDGTLGTAIMNGNGLNRLITWNNFAFKKNVWNKIILIAVSNTDTTLSQVVYFTGLNTVGNVIFANLQLEEGNKATSWSPSTDDIANIAGSSLSLTNNNITLGAKTITLDGTTIAKAIQAEDLVVGNKQSGQSALEVKKDGKFYAKGSTSNGSSSLIIDSDTQSIEMNSLYTSLGQGGTQYGQTKVKMSGNTGALEFMKSDYSGYATISSEGIYANKAGQYLYPISSGFALKAAIAANGSGNAPRNEYASNHDVNAIVGVAGIANNTASNPAPYYGGYFSNLKACGLILNTKMTEGSTYYLTESDSLVLSLRSSTVYLPKSNIEGRVVFLKSLTGTIRLYAPSGYYLYDDGSENTSFDIGEGWMAMCNFVDFYVNGNLRNVWVFSKFKW